MSDLKQLIDAQRETSFRPEYRCGVTDAEACGILVAHHFKWSGEDVLRVAVSALEDANYHREAAAVAKMLDELRAVA